MDFAALTHRLNCQFSKADLQSLNDAEVKVLEGIWQGKTYHQMAAALDYSPDYLSNDLGPKLLKRLTKLIGKPVRKPKCRTLLEGYLSQFPEFAWAFPKPGDRPVVWGTPDYPSGPLPLNSPLYIERPPAEDRVRAAIQQPGSLIRIKAIHQMGKSSLMLRAIARAKAEGYRTATIDFQAADSKTLDDVDSFFRWFCSKAAHDLGATAPSNSSWDNTLGYKVQCTEYWEDVILPAANAPLLLVLNEVDLLFERSAVAREFLPLLRYWHESAKQGTPFKNLHLVVVYATDLYLPLNLHQSPFNVGIPISLPPFTLDQVAELAARYGLHYRDRGPLERLRALTGGHPQLIQLALYEVAVADPSSNLEAVLEAATTQSGIYSHELRDRLGQLRDREDLMQAMARVVAQVDGVELEPMVAYQLERAGLVRMVGNVCLPFCDLYRQYFAQHLPTLPALPPTQVVHLESRVREASPQENRRSNFGNSRSLEDGG